MNNKFLLTTLVFVMLMGLPAVSAHAGQTPPEVYLSTQRTESRLLEVAVPAFLFSGNDVENLGEEVARVINHDLRFTGYFKPNGNYDFMRSVSLKDMEAGRVNYKEWRTLSSNFLVKGNISAREEGKLAVETRVYDLQARRLFFRKRYIGARAILRQIAHKFSNDLLKRLTGETGVARTKIAFVSRVAGRKELLLMDYDGFGPRAITSDRSIVLFPHWNQKRKNLILFTTYRYRNPDIYALNLKTGTRYPISRKIGLNATGEWSPDGSRVAFSLSRRGNSDIYTCDADGSNVKKLTRLRSIETGPAWSPDGKFIAFTSDRAGSPQIYAMKSDGSDKHRLTYRGGYNDGASWAPKGGLIAYASLLKHKFDIALVNFMDKSIRALTSDNASDETPSWAPDARHIAFSSNLSGIKQVYIINLDGSSKRQITFLGGGGYAPSWGPE